jgi:hypothetical protein
MKEFSMHEAFVVSGLFLYNRVLNLFSVVENLLTLLVISVISSDP